MEQKSRTSEYTYFEKMLKKANITYVGDDIDTCNSCIMAKQARLPFEKNDKDEKRATGLLDLVHSDVCGPMENASISGRRYMLTFIDDHSRYVWVHFLSGKNEVINKFNLVK